MSEIGRDVGISPTTAKQWLSVLQASNQIILLEPYYRSLGKRITKSPKLYFTDSELASFLMRFQSPQSLWNSREVGTLWETYVIGQWLRWRDWYSPHVSLWYWQDRLGNEVDLLLEINQRLIAIECKISNRPTSSQLKGIAKLRDFYGEAMIVASYIASITEQPYKLGDGTLVQNGWRVWELVI